MPDGAAWPRISVITPTYNQGHYIEETIRSVLLQGYPNLEYIIIDGGSTDNTLDIIRRYDPWITYWVSEPDRGQAHAINKGFERATGDLVGWINSDDSLLPNAAGHIGEAFRQHPQTLLLGEVIGFNETYGFSRLIRQSNVSLERFIEPWRYDGYTYLHQLGAYIPSDLNRQVGPLDESLRYTFDWDWLCRLLRLAPVHYLRVPVAQFRFHTESKTVGEAEKWLPEKLAVVERYGQYVEGFDRNLALAALELEHAGLYLHLQDWHRSKGLQYLFKAVSRDWRTVTLPGFKATCLRAITPVFLLQWVRTMHHKYLRLNSSVS